MYSPENQNLLFTAPPHTQPGYPSRKRSVAIRPAMTEEAEIGQRIKSRIGKCKPVNVS